MEATKKKGQIPTECQILIWLSHVAAAAVKAAVEAVEAAAVCSFHSSAHLWYNGCQSATVMPDWWGNKNNLQ